MISPLSTLLLAFRFLTQRSAIHMDVQDPRTLVLCFDGTNKHADSNRPSNVVEFNSFLTKDDPRQLTFYRGGFGTDSAPSHSKLLDAMFAQKLEQHIKSGYIFIMNEYKRGDQICIFGFSRGAYVARALAGMLCKVGLLPRHNEEQFSSAYKWFERDDEKGWRQSVKRRYNMARQVTIRFVGVWDTVASIGWTPRYLPFTRCNPAIEVFRHAVALDERRVKFTPYLFQRKVPNPQAADLNKKDKLEAHYYQEVYGHGVNVTDALEVWFPGCHSDVGGRMGPTGPSAFLSSIPLSWMVDQCRHYTAVQFDPMRLANLNTHIVLSLEPPILHDKLLNKTWWWMFEVLRVLVQRHEGTSDNVSRINRGRCRRVRKHGETKIHVSRTMNNLVGYSSKLEYEDHQPRLVFHEDNWQWIQWEPED